MILSVQAEFMLYFIFEGHPILACPVYVASMTSVCLSVRMVDVGGL